MKVNITVLIILASIAMVSCNFWDIQRRPNNLICEMCKKLAQNIQSKEEMALLAFILRLDNHDPKVYYNEIIIKII